MISATLPRGTCRGSRWYRTQSFQGLVDSGPARDQSAGTFLFGRHGDCVGFLFGRGRGNFGYVAFLFGRCGVNFDWVATTACRRCSRPRGLNRSLRPLHDTHGISCVVYPIVTRSQRPAQKGGHVVRRGQSVWKQPEQGLILVQHQVIIDWLTSKFEYLRLAQPAGPCIQPSFQAEASVHGEYLGREGLAWTY